MSERSGFYNTREWLALRYEALKASAGRCSCCGERPSEANPLHVDHIKPRSKHPEFALVLLNLQVLCKRCNLGKSNTDDTDWRWVTSVDESRLVSAFLLSDEERRARRELLDRSICGSTAAEREAARNMLDAINKYTCSIFEERQE
jgi:hypothetical protein